MWPKSFIWHSCMLVSPKAFTPPVRMDLSWVIHQCFTWNIVLKWGRITSFDSLRYVFHVKHLKLSISIDNWKGRIRHSWSDLRNHYSLIETEEHLKTYMKCRIQITEKKRNYSNNSKQFASVRKLLRKAELIFVCSHVPRPLEPACWKEFALEQKSTSLTA